MWFRQQVAIELSLTLTNNLAFDPRKGSCFIGRASWRSRRDRHGALARVCAILAFLASRKINKLRVFNMRSIPTPPASTINYMYLK